MLRGAVETKVRSAVVIASPTYLVERSDVLLGVLTTKLPGTDHICGLCSRGLAIRGTSSPIVLLRIRPHNPSLGAAVIGHLSLQD
jgi:hypothetical protein